MCAVHCGTDLSEHLSLRRRRERRSGHRLASVLAVDEQRYVLGGFGLGVHDAIQALRADSSSPKDSPKLTVLSKIA